MDLASCFPWRENHNYAFRQRAKKATLPWKSEKDFIKFEENVYQRQLDMEMRYEKEKNTGQVFLDRSLIDISGYFSAKGLSGPQNLRNAISEANYSLAIFLTTMTEEVYKSDYIRQESYKDALMISSYLLEAYKETQIPILVLPTTSNENRIKLIEKHIITPLLT